MHKQRIWMWCFGVLALIGLFLLWIETIGISFSGWDMGAMGFLVVAMIVVAMGLAAIDNREQSLGYIQLLLASICMGVFALFSGYNLYNLSVTIDELQSMSGPADVRMGWGIYLSFAASLVFIVGAWILRDPNPEKARANWTNDDILDDW
ncbi:MAG: hypothetical protein GY810_31105 [Aureispira sp.]|nr:hypothetical protein [Aureispira sp.]